MAKSIRKSAKVQLLVVAVMHVLRLAIQWQITVGGAIVPMWVSVVGAVVTAVLGVLLWREGKK